MVAWGVPILKKRSRVTGPARGGERKSGSTGAWLPVSFSPSVTESCWTFCHTGWWAGAAGTESDVGGEFLLRRNGSYDHIWAFGNSAQAATSMSRGWVTLSGVQGHTPQFVADLGTRAALETFGTRAIAETLPNNPHANLAGLIGEFKRDGMPSLPGMTLRDRVFNARDAGSEYLNIEFGWLPLLRDLQDLVVSAYKMRDIVEQYVRDSDRKIRRRWGVPKVLDNHVYTYTGGNTGFGLQNASTLLLMENVTCSCTMETQFSFSGAFRYHIPVADSFWSEFQRMETLANHVFGTRITPAVLWDLAPWSWLTGWFTNVDDVMTNISQLGADGLVMQYGYAMRHQRVESVQRGYFIQGGFSGSLAGQQVGCTLVSEVKQRVRANPYGFGVDDVSLSPRQLAILSALGLSGGKRDPNYRAPHP